MAIRIGELLVKQGMVTAGQVDEALKAQKMFGGRVGTNLVELGFISEQELAKFLSVQLSLPCIEAAQIDNVSDEVIKTVPLALATKYKVVPVGLERRKLKLAMGDPTDLKAIDEVSFSTGCAVQPVVTPELLITYALEKYYGIKRTTRYVKLSGASDMEFQVVQTGSSAQREAGPAPTAPVSPGAAKPAGAAVLEEARSDYLKDDAAQFQAPAFSLAEAARALAGITEQSEVFEVLRKMLVQDFVQSAIFVIRGPNVAGWLPLGCTIPEEEFRKLTFPLTESKLLEQVVQGKSACVCPIPPTRGDDRLVAALGLRDRAEVLAAPILVNSQPVIAFLGSSVREGTGREKVAVYEKLVKKVSFALQMTFLRRRILESS